MVLDRDSYIRDLAQSANLEADLLRVFGGLEGGTEISQHILGFKKDKDSLEIVLATLVDALFSGKGNGAILGLSRSYGKFWDTEHTKIRNAVVRLNTDKVLSVFDSYYGTDTYDKIIKTLSWAAYMGQDESALDAAADAMLKLRKYERVTGILAEKLYHSVGNNNVKDIASCFCESSIITAIGGCGGSYAPEDLNKFALIWDACSTGNLTAARNAASLIRGFDNLNSNGHVLHELDSILANTQGADAFNYAVGVMGIYAGSKQAEEIATKLREAATNVPGQMTAERLKESSEAVIELARQYSQERERSDIPEGRVKGLFWKPRSTWSEHFGKGLEGYRAYQAYRKSLGKHRVLVPGELSVGNYYQSVGGFAIPANELFIERDRKQLQGESQMIAQNSANVVQILHVPVADVQALARNASLFAVAKANRDQKLDAVLYTARMLLDYAA